MAKAWMKLFPAAIAAALVAVPALVAGAAPAPPAKSGAATVAYACADGREAVAVYEHGSDYRHAAARLTLDGRTIEMRAAPTLFGTRYRSESGQGAPPLAWTLRGERAWLTESPDADGYAGEERAIARCVRVRAAAAPAAPGAHGDSH